VHTARTAAPSDINADLSTSEGDSTTAGVAMLLALFGVATRRRRS
jgi:MYXO-CTERM domain-containing protein